LAFYGGEWLTAEAKGTPLPIEWVGPRAGLGTLKKMKFFLSLMGFEHWTIQSVAQSLYRERWPLYIISEKEFDIDRILYFNPN
jgi:hypothetical protein